MFKPKFALYLFITATLTLGLSISFQSLLAAWTAPSANPPTSTIKPPIGNFAADPTTSALIDRPLSILGNLTMSGNIVLNNNWISNNGTDEGIRITNDGKVGIGTSNPSKKLEVTGGDIKTNGYVILGNEAGPGTPETGAIRWHSNLKTLQVYDGTSWVNAVENNPDPCVGVTCNPYCQANVKYSGGVCVSGACVYTTTNCLFGCSGSICSSDPCGGVICNPPYCSGSTRYYNGTCSSGICNYSSQVCPFGCSGGVCNSDPCQGVACNSYCSGSTRYYNGSCSGGSCSYSSQNCPYGCSNGTCNSCTPSCPCSACGYQSDGCGGSIFCGDYGGGGTTPYIFVYNKNKYYIENDILSGYPQNNGLTIEETKKAYELGALNFFKDDSGVSYIKTESEVLELEKRDISKNSSTGKQFAPSDTYKLKLKPEIINGLLAMQIRELEPEESMIDHLRLIKIKHSSNSLVYASDGLTFGDVTFHNIKSQEIKPLSCLDNQGKDCMKTILSNDSLTTKKDNKDYILVKFSPNTNQETFIKIDAWMNEYIPQIISNPLEDGNSCSNSFNLTYIKEGKEIPVAQKIRVNVLPNSYYRQLNINDYTDKNGIVTLKISWGATHILDKISFLSVKNEPFSQEDLPLVSAIHSRYGDVKEKMDKKDFEYAHTVRGDKIDLKFSAGNQELENNETIDYFIISEGYYHGLRTYLYPNIDTSDSYKEEINGYIKELNEYLSNNKQTTMPKAFIDR